MPADYVLHLACGPKKELGSGDAFKGTSAILEMLKARSRAALLEESAARAGKSPTGMSLTVRFTGPDDKPVEADMTYDQLMAEAAPLKAHEGACAGCPANLFSQPFGCFGIITYPIARATEEWLMNRVQPTSMIGGFLCSRAVQDFGYTGEPIQRMRARGMLESRKALDKVVEKRWFSGKRITSDQILQGMLAVEEPLDPGHCMGVLLWLGCLTLDGRHLGGAEDAPMVEVIARLSPEERRTRTGLDLGPPVQDRSTASLQGLLHAFYLGWTLDLPVLVSY